MNLPSDDCKAPRDGLRPCKTGDMLFLVALLARAGNARYFREVGHGAVIPELVGVDPLDWRRSTDAKSQISRVTVRRWFREGFFPFRRILASGKASGHAIRFKGKELRNARRWKTKEPWTLGKSLKWPFEKGHDPLWSDLYKIPFFAWEEQRKLKMGEVYCPLDGPVVPVKADLISPPVTWERMCGRHWRSLLCPHCLGQIQTHLISMN